MQSQGTTGAQGPGATEEQILGYTAGIRRVLGTVPGVPVGTRILGAGPEVQGAPRKVLQQLGSMGRLEGYRGSSRGVAEQENQRSSGVGECRDCRAGGTVQDGILEEGTGRGQRDRRAGVWGGWVSRSSDVTPAPTPHRQLHVLAAGGAVTAGTSGMGRGRRPAAPPIGCGARATSRFKAPSSGRGRHCSRRHQGPRAPVVSRRPPPAPRSPPGPL